MVLMQKPNLTLIDWSSQADKSPESLEGRLGLGALLEAACQILDF